MTVFSSQLSVVSWEKSRRKRMIGKILIWLLATLLLTAAPAAAAQQPKKVPRIGFLATTDRDAPNIEPFRQGLRELGYIEGQNILVEYRYAEGKQDRFPSLVAEFVRLKVDALVSGNNSAVLSAKQLTKTIPVVMVLQQDPVVMGLVDSLARPGGNITGITLLTGDLSGKRLELLKEAVPRISRVGVLWTTATRQRNGFKDYQAAARALKISLQSLEVRGPNPDFEGAFRAAAKDRVNALITVRTGGFFKYPKMIAELAIKNRLPSMHEEVTSWRAAG
jgi:ABC-type uncharacterized transport system substrate-binding protein